MGRILAALAFALAAWLAPASAAAQSAVPVYRFFNDQTGTHFYTTSTFERDIVLSRWPQFLYEGPVFYAYLAQSPDTKPVFRFFDTATGTHFYTQSETERDQYIATQPTFLFEGAVYYAPFAPGVGHAALYRFYNTRTHARFYTDSTDERDIVLRTWPWFQLEGIAFYVFTTQTPPGSTDDSALKITLSVQSAGAGTVSLVATATDTGGFVTRVDFTMDGAPLATLMSEPFALSASVAPGNHVFSAVAHDTSGATRSSEPVAYSLDGPVVAKPKVTLSASATSVTLGQPVTLSATASEDGGTIAKVAFYAGATLLHESTAAPYAYTYTPAAVGALSYTAVATDAAGATATSTTVGLNVSAAGGTPPAATPKVTLAASPTTVTLGQSVTLTATASEDGGTISSVAIYAGGALVKTLTSSPFTTTYTPAAAGSLAFSAIATDAKGITATSGSTSVNINPVAGAVPKITLDASATSISVGQTVTLTATASEAGGTIKKVGFYSGTKLLTEVTSPPYTYSYTPAAGGTLSFSAIATDSKNVTATSPTIAVNVNAPVVSLLKVTLTSSTTFTQVPANVTLTANPTPAAGTTIASVDFYRNGIKLNTTPLTVKPYTFATSLTTAGQTSIFTARVTDSVGATATSTPVNVVTTTTPAIPVLDANSRDVWRLLTQATFGPTPADVASVKSLGAAGWIDRQFTQPVSGYPDTRYNHIQLRATPDCTSSDPAGNPYPANSPQVKCVRDHLSLNMVQRDFFTNAVGKPDQLRQRVAWALSQILVTSANESDLSIAYVMSRYQGILFQNAFGNFETLLQQVSLSPAMGNYLDAVNNDRPDGKGRVPNENYAREIMQLFSIGLEEIRDDGTPLLDANNQPIPTYDQDVIKEMARVFTGWTYANADGSTVTKKNSPFYAMPMANFPGTTTTGHDTDPKTLFDGTPPYGAELPAGQTALQDLTAAVHAVFMHPNTPAFISRQLIQKLVTGNPSTAYVQRIANVFKNDGTGVRGNLKAVVRALLLDSEARGSADKGDSFGSLREPVFVVTSLVRSLSGVTDGNTLSDLTNSLGQRVYYSPTVFNYFQPDTTVQAVGKTLNEPEFGIHDSNTAVGRANLVYRLVYQGVTEDANLDGAVGTKLDTQQFEPFADDPTTLVNQVNAVLMGGALPTAARDTIATAVAAIASNTDPTKPQWRTDRAQMAVYLVASSYYFQVQH
ncbi:MAG TPA: DUF1800 family protein [Casimicrobiaceae bacterium]|nr:DUF1800 family protein [Casimicrobiaceae bacterium]